MEYSKGGSNLLKVSDIGKKAILGTILPVIIKTLLKKKNIKEDVLDDNKISIIENVLRVKMIGPGKQKSETVKKDTSIKNNDFHFSTIREPRANAIGLSEFFTLHLKNLQEKNPDDKFIKRLLPKEIFEFEDTVIEGEVDEAKRQELENKKKVRNEILEARKEYEEKIKKQQEEFDNKIKEEFEKQLEIVKQNTANIEIQNADNNEKLKQKAKELNQKREDLKQAVEENKTKEEIESLQNMIDIKEKEKEELKQQHSEELEKLRKGHNEDIYKMVDIAIEALVNHPIEKAEMKKKMTLLKSPNEFNILNEERETLIDNIIKEFLDVNSTEDVKKILDKIPPPQMSEQGKRRNAMLGPLEIERIPSGPFQGGPLGSQTARGPPSMPRLDLTKTVRINWDNFIKQLIILRNTSPSFHIIMDADIFVRPAGEPHSKYGYKWIEPDLKSIEKWKSIDDSEFFDDDSDDDDSDDDDSDDDDSDNTEKEELIQQHSEQLEKLRKGHNEDIYKMVEMFMKEQKNTDSLKDLVKFKEQVQKLQYFILPPPLFITMPGKALATVREEAQRNNNSLVVENVSNSPSTQTLEHYFNIMEEKTYSVEKPCNDTGNKINILYAYLLYVFGYIIPEIYIKMLKILHKEIQSQPAEHQMIHQRTNWLEKCLTYEELKKGLNKYTIPFRPGYSKFIYIDTNNNTLVTNFSNNIKCLLGMIDLFKYYIIFKEASKISNDEAAFLGQQTKQTKQTKFNKKMNQWALRSAIMLHENIAFRDVEEGRQQNKWQKIGEIEFEKISNASSINYVPIEDKPVEEDRQYKAYSRYFFNQLYWDLVTATDPSDLANDPPKSAKSARESIKKMDSYTDGSAEIKIVHELIESIIKEENSDIDIDIDTDIHNSLHALLIMFNKNIETFTTKLSNFIDLLYKKTGDNNDNSYNLILIVLIGLYRYVFPTGRSNEEHNFQFDLLREDEKGTRNELFVAAHNVNKKFHDLDDSRVDINPIIFKSRFSLLTDPPDAPEDDESYSDEVKKSAKLLINSFDIMEQMKQLNGTNAYKIFFENKGDTVFDDDKAANLYDIIGVPEAINMPTALPVDTSKMSQNNIEILYDDKSNEQYQWEPPTSPDVNDRGLRPQSPPIHAPAIHPPRDPPPRGPPPSGPPPRGPPPRGPPPRGPPRGLLPRGVPPSPPPRGLLPRGAPHDVITYLLNSVDGTETPIGKRITIIKNKLRTHARRNLRMDFNEWWSTLNDNDEISVSDWGTVVKKDIENLLKVYKKDQLWKKSHEKNQRISKEDIENKKSIERKMRLEAVKTNYEEYEQRLAARQQKAGGKKLSLNNNKYSLKNKKSKRRIKKLKYKHSLRKHGKKKHIKKRTRKKTRGSF